MSRDRPIDPTRRQALQAALAAAAALVAKHRPATANRPPPRPARPRWIGHG